ncbi:hypothetical protein CFOL_v3_04311 [Cephalotus follicularis]|uniref:DUF7780 domain-containing protein n=1 Tax=Cephalotus follicularis TaxID=3775 RepID=A0A1Q3AYZ9_CEPFO|nr:hypothetical protein CFOL_v3_04311 [Cephalotus follicularis]
MGFMSKAKSNTTTSGSEKRSMSFLLVFFPADHNNNNNSNHLTTASLIPNTTTATKVKRSTNSSRLLISKAQFTISICVLLVFLTLLLFTLSTFEPTITTPTTPRRFLSHELKTNTNHNKSSWSLKIWNPKIPEEKANRRGHPLSFALQRMGTLYRRGTRAMSDLVIGHVGDDVVEDELKLFLRVIHRSGLTARADLLFIFASPLLSSRFGSLIHEENESFLKLVRHFKEMNKTVQGESLLGFDLTHYVKFSKKEMGEPLWGKRIRVNSNSSQIESDKSELTRLSYGSVVGFEANELDPEDSLAGFLDHIPMSLRRWACYPMLLGRLRRNFKHVILIDVKNAVVLGDPLCHVRNWSPESVHISILKQDTKQHHKKINSDKTQSHFLVNSVFMMGGARGIRRLSTVMLTGIVRAAMQQKKRNSVTESAILSQLVGNEYLLKDIHLVKSTESIPELSSLTELSFAATRTDCSVAQRGNSNYDINSIIMKQICSCEVDSFVYRDS